MASDALTVNQKSKELLERLSSGEQLDFDLLSQTLSEFRILTREKSLRPEVIDKRCIELLIRFASDHQTEAQKCLSNLILNYAHMREQIIEPYVDCVEKRFTKILDSEPQASADSNLKNNESEILYYDLRIIFLLSALCPASRSTIRDRLVDLILRVTDRAADKFSRENNLLVVESLKTLFNLSLDRCINEQLAGTVLKKLFAAAGSKEDPNSDNETEEKLDLTDQLLVNLIHLMTNMPKEVYLHLSNSDVTKILEYLDSKLKTADKSNTKDIVLPVLNVCANICKYNEEIRKKWFDEILRSSREFEKRPEEYDNLKGRLVKLMTSVDIHVKDIAAEFLYALCGGDTEKLITYTGFGNSAAFLSTRGLLGSRRQVSSGQQSLEENEEYQRLRKKIDPMTGKLDVPKKNPMEGMSDEQKEFHAHELAEAITKLTSLGIVKPMKVDEEGNLSDLHISSVADTQVRPQQEHRRGNDGN